MRAILLFAVVSGLAGALGPARAEEPSAEQVLERARRSGAMGLVGARAEVTLVVDDGQGGRKERRLTATALQLPGGEVRRLVRFHDPAEVRGVGFLVVEKGGQTERLLYLPAQKRVRRVSGSAGGGAFLSTDFSYADLDLAGGAGDLQQKLADETVDGHPCWVVATRPADSPYGRVVTSVHRDTGVPLRVVYEDRDGKVVKRLQVQRVKQVDGHWYAFESVLETVGRGTKTTLTITALDPKAALSPDDFTEQALERL